MEGEEEGLGEREDSRGKGKLGGEVGVGEEGGEEGEEPL